MSVCVLFGCKVLSGDSETICVDVTKDIGEQLMETPDVKRVAILDCATGIPEYAFHNCTSLTEIVIPDSVTEIGMYAFDGCTSLAEIVIPDSVTEIGSYAFYGCTSLTEVNWGGKTYAVDSHGSII